MRDGEAMLNEQSSITKQTRKHQIGLAGEFLVAGELLRRGISAAVTYGNAKKADVIAVEGTRAVTIEVKSTQKARWVVGPRAPDPQQAAIWTFVFLPEEDVRPPEFYVISGEDLHSLLKPKDDKYCAAYVAKHGVEFSGNGVCSVARAELQPFKSNWSEVSKALGLT